MTAAEKKKETLSPRKILAGDLQRSEYSRASYRIIVRELETSLEDILKPEYWVNCGDILKGSGLHPFPIIEMIWEDGSRYLELIVIHAAHLSAKVKVLMDVDLSGIPSVKESDKPAKNTKAPENKSKDDDGSEKPDDGKPEYKVKWLSPKLLYGVVRTSDNERMTEGHETKEAAQTWLDDYLKAIAD